MTIKFKFDRRIQKLLIEQRTKRDFLRFSSLQIITKPTYSDNNMRIGTITMSIPCIELDQTIGDLMVLYFKRNPHKKPEWYNKYGKQTNFDFQ